MLLAGILLVLCLQLYFLSHYTRKYKDCGVPWSTVAQEQRQLLGIKAAGGGAQVADKQLRIAVVSMATKKRGAAANGGTGAELAGQLQQGSQAPGEGSDRASVGPPKSPKPFVNARAAAFEGLLDITGPNKAQYAALHGYTYIDASDLLDTSRPASWSKIPAVLSALASHDWVFWVDADTLVTNPAMPLEELLPAGEHPDLLLTRDMTGVNAGVWLVRGGLGPGAAWAQAFLRHWWAQDSFVRRGAADTKSGDNDALKALVAAMDPAELSLHVGIAPQCAFNSYVWRPSLRNWARYAWNPRHVLTGLWQPGDFLVHPAGVNDKAAALRRIMARIGTQEQGQGQRAVGQLQQLPQQQQQQLVDVEGRRGGASTWTPHKVSGGVELGASSGATADKTAGSGESRHVAGTHDVKVSAGEARVLLGEHAGPPKRLGASRSVAGQGEHGGKGWGNSKRVLTGKSHRKLAGGS